MSLYENFINEYPVYGKSRIVKEAFEFAQVAHEGQDRMSGEPFIMHPIKVAEIVAILGLDDASVTAALLHDVAEDTSYTLEDIQSRFGDEIAAIVDGVTKLDMIEYKTREEQQAETVRKMIMSMASDIRVIIVKLADRLHNMQTLKYLSEDKQTEKASETLEIYAPIAHRLGISTIKWELEDLSLKYLEPEKYFEIAKRLTTTRGVREEYIWSIAEKLRERISAMGIEAKIEGRPKHIYSIYKKMIKYDKTFDELYDLLALRLIVNTIKDCYAVLGVVHTLYKPLPMRFKDYIAVPKPNMYQSLHTTLVGEDGLPFEVQIRTFDMHRTAEYGIAAHWKYKENAAASDGDMDSKLAWLRELTEWQTDVKDPHEFMEALKIDFFSDKVFVFTPKGDVRDLPKGATPLDFAYAIHSGLGNKCTGAKVNGNIVPLGHTLKTGDIVEILSIASKGPSRDWLNIVKTAQARNKIRQWFRKQLKEENLLRGKEQFEKELKALKLDEKELLKPEYLDAAFKKFNLLSIDDMYAAIGYGGITSRQIITRLMDMAKKDAKIEDLPKLVRQAPKTGEAAVSVEGFSDMVVKLAGCCSPVPGDEIIGYITRGRGVSVHRAGCSNINDVDFAPERRIHVEWIAREKTKYNVEIKIVGLDRAGFLGEISQVMASTGHSMSSVVANTKNKQCVMNVRFAIADIGELTKVIDNIKKVRDVLDVHREC